MLCLCPLRRQLGYALCPVVTSVSFAFSAAQNPELSRHRICVGPVDLTKRLLFDLWDKDAAKSDFLGFVEVSLQELVLHAQNKTAIPVQAPAEVRTSDAGLLYVEKAALGFPRVRFSEFLAYCISNHFLHSKVLLICFTNLSVTDILFIDLLFQVIINPGPISKPASDSKVKISNETDVNLKVQTYFK
jgi:hypothetical protein